MKKSIKKTLIYLSTALISSIFISFIYIFFSSNLQVFDNKLRDYLFHIRGEIPNSNNIIIVDIDEKSLSKFGQWPWSRNKLSKILKNLTQSNVGLIAFDVVFAEEDRTSPHKILKEYSLNDISLPNYDEIFAQTIASTPTILGYQFQLENKEFIKTTMPQIPAVIIEKNKPENSDLITAKGTILNTKIIQENSYSSGFFNNIPDELGVIRSIPLLISYDEMLFPSLALEIIRIASQESKVYVNYDQNGISNIDIGNFSIPTDKYGRMIVNFRGKEKNFKYISAYDIFNNNFNPQDIEGKIVLIGTSAAGLLDLRATVFESVFPGVEVHANAIDNILSGDVISKPSWIHGFNIFAIFILSIITILITTYVKLWIKPLIALSFIGTIFYINYYFLFNKYLTLGLLFPILTVLLSVFIATLIDYFYTIKKEEMIKNKFASKVSKSVMDKLLENPDNNNFQAMEREITVFFSDVRGFTNISEEMGNAKNLIDYLNKYMEPMTNIITKNGGTIDKYIGDAIMAYWNAPIDMLNHADKALSASLEQIKYLDILNNELSKNNLPLIDIGIGLNTGIAVAGEMGSTQRSDYTVIGDAINLGARLESLCKFYDSKINISNFTKDELKEEYVFRFLDLVQVKGKIEPVEIWQVIDFGKAKNELKIELQKYHNAIKLYKNSQFKEALEIFINLEKNPNKSNKNIYGIYINRCKEFIKTPPKNFDGVYIHNTKA